MCDVQTFLNEMKNVVQSLLTNCTEIQAKMYRLVHDTLGHLGTDWVKVYLVVSSNFYDSVISIMFGLTHGAGQIYRKFAPHS